ncbi:MAG: FecR domain-containing protein [Alphaproteobacteria bacterium]
MTSIGRTGRRLAAGCLAAAALVTLSVAAGAAAGPQIAMVKTASGDAAIVREGVHLAAKVGDALFEKDVIETGPDGSIGITFTDNTVMSTGPDSQLSLEQYKFDSSNFNGSMLAEMRKGTLAVVSGDIARAAHDTMKIKTPTAILGVRGTRFTVEVEEQR